MLTRCGCGRHYIRVGGSNTVMWNDEQWDAKCAFEQAKSELDQNPSNIRKLIAHVPCYMCNSPVGRQYEICGSTVSCMKCKYDLGGQG